MRKIAVFFCSHHSGHINPISSLVPLFTQRGWEVHFVTASCRKEFCVKQGAIFHSIDSDRSLHEAAMDSCKDLQVQPTAEMQGQFFPEQILPATVLYLEQGLVARVARMNPDLIVSDVSGLWGVLTARFLDVPLVTSCSCMLFEDLESPFSYLRKLPAQQACVDTMQRRFNLEYDPVCSYMNETDFTIAWTFADFQPPTRQSSNNVRFYGAALSANIDDKLEEDAKQNVEVVRFLTNSPSDASVIYCSLGTVVGQEPWTMAGTSGDMVADFYCRLMDTLGNRSGYRVILSIGFQRSIPANIPANFYISQCVPQLLVLDRVDAFITHCGNNGVHEAFFVGCPMICVPVFGDQHPNAANIAKLNAGVHIASPFAPAPSPHLDHVTAQVLQRALDEVLVVRKDEVRAACQKIKTIMREKYDYFHSNAADEIEAFVEQWNTTVDAVNRDV